jgi:hypothetical protein
VNEEAPYMEDDKTQQPKYYEDNKESPKCAKHYVFPFFMENEHFMGNILFFYGERMLPSSHR